MINHSTSLYIQAAATLAVFILGSAALRYFLSRWLNKIQDSQQRLVARIALRLAHLVIIVLGILSALKVLGINTTPILTGFGLGGFAITYASKDTISNLVAGFLILIYEPFRLGDRIQVGSDSGIVHNINFRYTTVETDAEALLIPNGVMLTSTIRKQKTNNAQQSS